MVSQDEDDVALGDLAGIIDQPLSVAASVFVFNMVFLAIAVWFPINTVSH
jgi:hypothetical protein